MSNKNDNKKKLRCQNTVSKTKRKIIF